MLPQVVSSELICFVCSELGICSSLEDDSRTKVLGNTVAFKIFTMMQILFFDLLCQWTDRYLQEKVSADRGNSASMKVRAGLEHD